MSFSKTSEVLIIGGGVIGLSIVRALHKKNVGKITILERGRIGRESSFAAAGMLAPQSEADKADEFFHFCSDSRNLYRNFAEELLNETDIDVELDCSGTLYLAFSERDAEEIRRRFEWQKKSGLAVEHLSAEEVRKIEPFVSPNVREALFFPDDWQVENRKLLAALAKYANLNDIEIIENAEVKNFIIEDHSKIVGAETVEGKFFAEKIILAAGAWTSLISDWTTFTELDGVIRGLLTVRPIRGQMISFKAAKRLFAKVIYTTRGYIVPRGDGRILAGATVEDVGFDKSLTDSGIEFLRRNAFEIAPDLANLKISEKWAGLRPRTTDGLPILGTLPQRFENFFLATAHYRNGILLAPLTAKILADKIADGVDSKYLEIFGISRFYRMTA